jgi:hypothetical protein
MPFCDHDGFSTTLFLPGSETGVGQSYLYSPHTQTCNTVFPKVTIGELPLTHVCSNFRGYWHFHPGCGRASCHLCAFPGARGRKVRACGLVLQRFVLFYIKGTVSSN